MNNFKKLLASAMALTMVTSVLPANPVNAALETGTSSVCGTYDNSRAISLARELINAIEGDLARVDKTIYTVDYEETLTFKNAYTWLNGNSSPISLKNIVTMGNFKETESDESTLINVQQALALLADCDSTSEEGIAASYIVGYKATNTFGDLDNRYLGITNATAELNEGNGSVAELVVNYAEEGEKYYLPADTSVPTTGAAKMIGQISSYDEYKAEYDKLTHLKDLSAYFGNMDKESQDRLNIIYDELIPVMEEEVMEAGDKFLDKVVKEYVEELEDATILSDGKEGYEYSLNEINVKDFVNGKTFERKNLSKLEDFVENLKADKIVAVASYEEVAEFDEVAEIITTLEDGIEEIENVNSLLNTTSDGQRALRAVGSKLNSLWTAVEDYNNAVEIETSVDKEWTDLQVALTKFTAKDLENVQTYVEEVYNAFYTNEVVERQSGEYVVRTRETDLVRFLNEDEIPAGNPTYFNSLVNLMTTLVDKNSDETYFDLLGTNTSDITEWYEACTEGIEGLTLASTFTDGVADRIIAARNAYNALEDTDFAGLTASQKREVRANADLIKALYAKLVISGVVVKDWWQFENGQWVYYDNGKTVSNVWVASNATDWYYAGANGVMLTNSWIARDSSGSIWYYVNEDGLMVRDITVDGYYIDANGEWHA